MALHAGTIEDMRLHNFTAVRVMDRLKEMDETLIFGYEYVVGCVNSLQKTEEQRTLNEMCDSVKKLEKLMPLYEGLGQKIDEVAAEVDAVRVDQEGKKCPSVFFLLPADTSSWSRLQKLERAGVFTKNMHLFFLCRMFLEDMKRDLQQLQQQQQQQPQPQPPQPPQPPPQQGVNVKCIPNLHGHECSECVDIKQPRALVKNCLPALRLSIKVVKTLALAASVGFPLAGVLPDMDLPALADMEAALQEGLEAAEKEATECDGRAHAVLQKYLQDHDVDWKSKVVSKLKPASNSSHGYAYVCNTEDQKHEKEWGKCGVAPMAG